MKLGLSLESKKRLVNLAVATLAGTGLFLFTLGTYIGFVGLTGVAIIKAGEVLNPYPRIFKIAMYCGGVGVGTGFFVIGFGMAIADTIGEKIIDEEVDIELRNTISNLDFQKPFASPECVGCKNYHGSVYNGVRLICAIHPHGPENKCPDWLGYAEKD